VGKYAERAKAAQAPVEGPKVTAKGLQQELGGSIEQRLESEKRILLTMKSPSEVDVQMLGFWNGKLVRAATNAIERSYRTFKNAHVRDSVAEKSKREKAEMEAKDVANASK